MGEELVRCEDCEIEEDVYSPSMFYGFAWTNEQGEEKRLCVPCVDRRIFHSLKIQSPEQHRKECESCDHADVYRVDRISVKCSKCQMRLFSMDTP